MRWYHRSGVQDRAFPNSESHFTWSVEKSVNDYDLNLLFRDFLEIGGLGCDKKGGTATNG
jgi:hypothetical protein